MIASDCAEMYVVLTNKSLAATNLSQLHVVRIGMTAVTIQYIDVGKRGPLTIQNCLMRIRIICFLIEISEEHRRHIYSIRIKKNLVNLMAFYFSINLCN